MRLALYCMAASVALPSGASAATMIVSLTGTVTKEMAAGQDQAPIRVGDQLTLSASIDTSLVRPFDSNGVTMASFYYAGSFSAELAGYSWIPRDEIMDGDDFAYGGIIAPALLFRDKKVIGLIGNLLPAQGPTPNLQFNDLNPLFRVGNDQGYYNNTYNGPAFEGRWNFELSSAAVPEPSAWAMMLLGFGAVGYAMRLRRRSRPIAAA